MKILISSGIYPPDIGGPAQYARNLYETWKKQGHDVKVAAYRWERALPPFIRHLLFLTKIIRKGWNADLILVLDLWSAAVPTMYACMLMRKKYIIRTGGDFLWESYVERTGDMVYFKNFYQSKDVKLTTKEKIYYSLGKKALKRASKIIYSTEWQRSIFAKAYDIDKDKTTIVENFCGNRVSPIQPENRSFIAATREVKWKNIETLREAFEIAKQKNHELGLPDIELDTGKAVYDSFFEKIRRSYAVILVSIGDISPNMILDAIHAGTPFIVTEENGITERIRPCAIFVDPMNKQDIVNKILWLSDPKNYALQKQKIIDFKWVHTWENIAAEIININKSVISK